MSDNFKGHTPEPWTLEHEEPFEAQIVTADGRRVPGLKVWLDDACHDENDTRLANGYLAAAAPRLLRERDEARAALAAQSEGLAKYEEHIEKLRRELAGARAEVERLRDGAVLASERCARKLAQEREEKVKADLAEAVEALREMEDVAEHGFAFADQPARWSHPVRVQARAVLAKHGRGGGT